MFICGMPRSGSMWTFNVTRRVLEAAGYEVHSFGLQPAEAEAELSKSVAAALFDRRPNQAYIWKTHAALRSNIPGARYITNYRDLRSATCSYMRFTRCTFERALEATRAMMPLVDHYFTFPDEKCLKLKYDQILNAQADVVESIAAFLGQTIDDETTDRIVTSFTRARVTEMVRGLERGPGVFVAPNLDGSDRWGDAVTGFQSGHVSETSGDCWRADLTPVQLASLEQLCGGWLERYGFVRAQRYLNRDLTLT